MRTSKNLMVGLIVALLAVSGSFAGTDLNEVGALLVYPMVAAFELDKAGMDPTNVLNEDIQTILTITNAGGADVVAHVSFIDGQSMQGNPVTELSGAQSGLLLRMRLLRAAHRRTTPRVLVVKEGNDGLEQLRNCPWTSSAWTR